MTARELIKANPQQEGESNESYFRRLVNPNNSYLAIRSKYYKLAKKFVETQRKYDKQGNIISRTEKLQPTELALPPEHLELSRLSTNESTGQQWKIYTKESQNKALFELNKDVIEQSVKASNIKPLKVAKIKLNGNKVLKVTYTDTHIGMHIKNDLYDSGKWGKEELEDTLKEIVSQVNMDFDGHSKIVVQELGDFCDGYNAETTRGGHKLPQNMDNVECFKIASSFKIRLASSLATLGVPLEFHSVVNDNHSGDFGHIVNLQVKEVLKYLLPDVEYNIHDQFISHYTIDNWAFIITHGKDKEFKKFGFKAQLDQKAKDHIRAYIDKHNLHSFKICFEKGDSHQLIRDSSNPKFEYNSYFALSPSSEWVSTNFAKGRRGFAIEEIDNNIKSFKSIEL
tara:strand:+ start:168 stop:1358 length:1191 start_codon:yes stop_codon:yes gene_type:complete